MSRRPGPTLAERAGLPEPLPVDVAPATVRAVVQRHCWVTDPPEWPGRWPGLLVEWRQAAGTGAWEGRVLYVTTPRPGVSVVVEAWLPAPRLRPT